MKKRTILDFMISGRRINLKHLRAFRAVALHSHFTRAADAIGLSQPALSTLITQLEEDLSVRLFNRTTRAVELTPVGREFLESCLRILADFEGAIGAAKDYADLRTGRLRIAVLPSLSRTLLPGLLREYHAEYPGIALSVSDLVGDRLVEEVVSGAADIGIGYSEGSALIAAEPLLADRLVAVCRIDAVPGDASAMNWHDLARHDVVAMNLGTTVRRLMDEGARQAEVELHVMLESHQMPTALAYVRAGLGVAVLPSTAAMTEAETDLVFLPLTDPVMTRQLSILTRTDQSPSPAVAAFIDRLRQTLATVES
ncbi:MAG: hypothetical protein CMN72_14920 [Sphingomonas sp.]|nr:hypothetical protein [Sphingomonas sp.]